MNLQSLLIFLAGSLWPSFVLALLGTYFVRWNAARFGLIDLPSERKVHTSPTPRGGGIAVWLGVVGTFAVAQLLLWYVKSGGGEGFVPAFAKEHVAGAAARVGELWILLAAGTLLMLLGLADDRGGLSWQLRLAVEFAVAGVCVWLIPNLRATAFIPYPFIPGALSVLWIVALINAFNMLDNMDGLSAGVAAISASVLAAVLLLSPDPATGKGQLFKAGLLFVLVGSLLGFLWHNRPPAKIFMGDSGSYFIGFMIAVATLLASYTGYHSEKRHAILAPLLVMAVPLYDMTTVILIRLKNGLSPFAADKNHFSHRLVDLGLTKTQAVLTIYLMSATCGLSALLLHRVDRIGAILILFLIASVIALIAILESTGRRERK
jgi:UDP-GlcNAc:undecaprenyl-phosphate GlcNAc-1-phosphate transferase